MNFSIGFYGNAKPVINIKKSKNRLTSFIVRPRPFKCVDAWMGGILKDHYAKAYPTHDLRDPDTLRYQAWEHDFDSLMRANAVPRLSTLRMLSDHTEGATAGRPTPFAHVADNDLAVGRMVAHIAKSPTWANSVIFIVEDDAQNGPDHVDAHRSPAYITGGFVKRNFTDHTMYSTSSVLRTIELILYKVARFVSKAGYLSAEHKPGDLS